MLEKTLESPLDSKEIKPVHPKGNQPWIFIGRTYAKAEAPVLWALDAKSQLTGKVINAGKDWEQEEKGMMEDEMTEWHHWLNGHEFEQTLGANGQWSLVCCSPWGCKEWDMTEQLNNNRPEIKLSFIYSYWYSIFCSRSGSDLTKLYIVWLPVDVTALCTSCLNLTLCR